MSMETTWRRVQDAVSDYWDGGEVRKNPHDHKNWMVWGPNDGPAHALIGFDPTVDEARAVMAIPARFDCSNPIRRDEVTLVSRPEVEPRWMVEARALLPDGWTFVAAGESPHDFGPTARLRGPGGETASCSNLCARDLHPVERIRHWAMEVAKVNRLPDPYGPRNQECYDTTDGIGMYRVDGDAELQRLRDLQSDGHPAGPRRDDSGASDGLRNACRADTAGSGDRPPLPQSSVREPGAPRSGDRQGEPAPRREPAGQERPQDALQARPPTGGGERAGGGAARSDSAPVHRVREGSLGPAVAYAPQEPRPFVVGDRVRHANGEDWAGTVEVATTGVDLVRVSFDGRRAMSVRRDNLTLITPAPPITIEGDAAVLPVPETEPPDPRADWVCERCGEDDLDNGGELCGWCEAEDAVEAERKANPQRMPDFDALNELGFPRMPSQPFIEHLSQLEDMGRAAMALAPAQAGVRPIPLDCFLRDREAVRVWSEKLDAKHEAERAGPCIGDLVTAWYQEESKVPTRLTGVVVEMDDRFISLRRLGRYDVCLREGAEVVTRKEQL